MNDRNEKGPLTQRPFQHLANVHPAFVRSEQTSDKSRDNRGERRHRPQPNNPKEAQMTMHSQAEQLADEHEGETVAEQRRRQSQGPGREPESRRSLEINPNRMADMLQSLIAQNAQTLHAVVQTMQHQATVVETQTRQQTALLESMAAAQTRQAATAEKIGATFNILNEELEKKRVKKPNLFKNTWQESAADAAMEAGTIAVAGALAYGLVRGGALLIKAVTGSPMPVPGI